VRSQERAETGNPRGFRSHLVAGSSHERGLRSHQWLYHGGLLGAHMHDSRATRSGEVNTMIGKRLGALLSTPTRQIRLSGQTDAEVDFVPGSRGHGL
jgi:hypothetical protein